MPAACGRPCASAVDSTPKCRLRRRWIKSSKVSSATGSICPRVSGPHCPPAHWRGATESPGSPEKAPGIEPWPSLRRPARAKETSRGGDAVCVELRRGHSRRGAGAEGPIGACGVEAEGHLTRLTVNRRGPARSYLGHLVAGGMDHVRHPRPRGLQGESRDRPVSARRDGCPRQDSNLRRTV